MKLRSVMARIAFCALPLLPAACVKSPPPQPIPAVPPKDTRKEVYDLNEKCGHDARDWYKHFYEDQPQVQGIKSQSNYTNYYNAASNKCFILIGTTGFMHDKKTGKLLVSDSNPLPGVRTANRHADGRRDR